MTRPGAGRRAKAMLIAGFVALAMAAPALAGSISYATFVDTSGLKLNKSAKTSGSTIHLTEDGTIQKSGSFFTKKKFLRTNRSFETTFSFQTLSDGEAADGFTFVLQSGEATAVGDSGFALGYGGIKKSFAVGFDEYPTDFVEIYKNGDVNDPVSEIPSPVGLVGGVRYGWVDYDAESHEIAVYLADGETKPAEPFLVNNRNLSKLGSKVRVGFTGSTGGFNATHEIRDLYANNGELVRR